MAFDGSANFSYTGKTEYWTKPIGISTVYIGVKGAGGGGNTNTANGGGGAYIFSIYNLNPNLSYNVAVNVGSGGLAPPMQTGGKSIGGQTDSNGIPTTNNNGGDGSTLNDLKSGGGGGMSSVFYVDSYGNPIIKVIAGGGGGAGNDVGDDGGDASAYQLIPGLGYKGVGLTGLGVGGGQGGNTAGTGNPGIGGLFGGSNGSHYIDVSYNDASGNSLYIFRGGAGGFGGTFAGGGGGAGYGGGAGGRQGGGGGGGSYWLADGVNYTCIAGAGGAGGRSGQSGANGSVFIFWNIQTITPPAIVSMYMLNAQHTSESIYIGPIRTPLQVNTITSIALPGETFPNQGVIYTNNILYIVTGSGTLCSFNPDLSLRWIYRAPGNYPFQGTPCLNGNGTLYLTSQNYLYAIADTGKGRNNGAGVLKWKVPFSLDAPSSVSPVMDLSGRIYIGTNNGSIYAVDDGLVEGVPVWSQRFLRLNRNKINGTPTFDISFTKICYTDQSANSSTIYMLDLSSNKALAPTMRWSKPAPVPPELFGSPTIDSYSSTVFVNTNAGNVYAYDISSGNLRWDNIGHVNDTNLSAMAISTDNQQLYFTTQKAFIVMNSSSGTLEWMYPIVRPTGSTVVNSIPMVDSNNIVFFGGCDNNIHCVNGLTRTYKWNYSVGGAIPNMPLLQNNNNLLFGSNDGKIYDLSGNGPPPSTTAPIAPMYMLNPQHTGLSPYSRPTTTPIVDWSANFISGNWFVSPSVAIGADGTLYLGSNNGLLYALNPYTHQSISSAWPVRLNTTASAIYTTPAIAPDGTIYIGSDEGYLYAVTAAGKKKWAYYAGSPLESSPLLDQNGNIYFGAGNKMYALGDAGYTAYPKWLTPFAAGDTILSSPALGQNSFIYFGSLDGYVYALDSFTGSLKWQYNTTLPIFSSPTVDSSNNVIIGNGSQSDGTLYYLDGTTLDPLSPSLRRRWAQPFQDGVHIGPFYNTPAVNGDTIYFSTIVYVYAVNRVDGSVNWQTPFYGNQCYYTSPIVDANGNIYVASIDSREGHGFIHVLSSVDGTELCNHYNSGVVERLAPPVLGNDGRLYISSTADTLYALN